jgi:hypothetical protein
LLLPFEVNKTIGRDRGEPPVEGAAPAVFLEQGGFFLVAWDTIRPEIGEQVFGLGLAGAAGDQGFDEGDMGGITQLGKGIGVPFLTFPGQQPLGLELARLLRH